MKSNLLNPLWTNSTLIDEDVDDRVDGVARADTSRSRGQTGARPNRRICMNCGKYFLCAPSSKTKTCSAACSSRHRSRKKLGHRPHDWTDSSRAKASEAAKRTGNFLLGTAAARASRKSGPFESNINAKIWEVVSPTGDEYAIKNLRLWCLSNADLFLPFTGLAAYAGLRQVAASLRGKTPRPVGQWRGWRLNDLPRAP